MKKFQLILICMIVSLVILPCVAMAELKVTFLDTGESGTVLVQADGQTALIDALVQTDADALLSVLSSLGAAKIDLMAETIPAGQPRGEGAVLDKLQPSAIWLPTTEAGEQAAGGLAGAAVPASGQSFMIGSAKITALPVSSVSEPQVPALALRIEYGQRAFLILPQATSMDAGSILGDGKKVDVVRMKSETHPTFEEGTFPFWIISDSSPEKTEDLPKEVQVPLTLHPSLDGIITFISDGDSILEEHKAGGITSQGSVNVRKEAATTAKRVTTLTKGAVVTITGSVAQKDGAWYQVKVGEKIGYIRADLVQELTQEEVDYLLAEATPKPQKTRSNTPPASTGEEEPHTECH